MLGKLGPRFSVCSVRIGQASSEEAGGEICIGYDIYKEQREYYNFIRESDPLTPRYPHVRLHPLQQLLPRPPLCGHQPPLRKSATPSRSNPSRDVIHWERRCPMGSLTAPSHLRSSSAVHPSGSPLGSGCAGNMSLPHIDQAAAAVMAPPNAASRQNPVHEPVVTMRGWRCPQSVPSKRFYDGVSDPGTAPPPMR